jgi:uncharacterized protein (DUF1697 family)
LLRGINVGGKNIIKMADLKATFESLGYQNVQTYIQSGNVIFSAPEQDKLILERQLEGVLSAAFAYDSTLILRSLFEMNSIVYGAPAIYGTDRAHYFYDVIFLKETLSPSEALEYLVPKDGIDQAYPGDGVVYFMRLIAQASRSQLTRLTGLRIFPSVTIRNWNTTTTLFKLMQAI